MRFNHRIRMLLALATLEGIASLPCLAQSSEPVRTKEAVAAPQMLELELPVQGLTAENVEGLRADLAALEIQVHRCSACRKEAAEPGSCPGCKGPLEPVTRSLFTAVEPSAKTNVVSLTPDPMAVVKLTQIETTLGKRSVRIDDEQFKLAGRAQLLIACPPTEAPAIEKALTDAKLFAEVKVAEPAASPLLVTVRAGPKPPSRAQVKAALQGAKAQLADVVWRPLPARS